MRLNYKLVVIALLACFLSTVSIAQISKINAKYSHADTLRGSLTPERTWWDVQRYELAVTPDFNAKSISGSNAIVYKVVARNNGSIRMQIDLKDPLIIDSVLYNKKTPLKFTREGSVWYVQVPPQKAAQTNQVMIYYHGKVHQAIRAPWDGGFIFGLDSLSRPWMTVACQGLGASVWYPNKDHQSDEPDLGASLTMTVPDTLTAIANGRLQYKKNNNDGTTTYKYNVVSPISTYCLIPYIGKYVNFNEVYNGEGGPLDVNYWVLDYNLAKATAYMPDQVRKMFKSMEYWFGPYPFYKDGYQLIDAPHTGMEHQSAVSYGNKYKFGYLGRDASGYGWGMKWDFIIIHESGHEWFGNNITSNDLADMWVHEGFTNYSESLFVDYHFGKTAGDEYNYGIRKGIRNDKPILADYQVNAQGSGDMYPKGGNLLHSIRHGMNDDESFRQILRGLNQVFYHQTVNSADVEAYISKKAKFDYSKVFDQYLRTVQVPVLEYQIEGSKLSYRYTNCINGFNLPLALHGDNGALRIVPAQNWQTADLKPGQDTLFSPGVIEKMYYVKQVRVAYSSPR
ncbi:M1 family metallopeptidase [Pedobacter metabolipauper]|uniref:Peptidase M1-like protein n=1 Tax=Pedobacter metabolipauper TaxID=425513 RepID=A0A4R6SQR5_9SPHI|nr:M1 family metallopeptidase [Pedobacter metabolipauper]TDQ06640.1 peptidase M1-like protein [Pedobacter metabolipauper]